MAYGLSQMPYVMASPSVNGHMVTEEGLLSAAVLLGPGISGTWFWDKPRFPSLVYIVLLVTCLLLVE